MSGGELVDRASLEGPSRVWIGLVLVHQRPGVTMLMDQNDAYVQTLAMASNAAEYLERVRHAFDELGFDILESEDVDPIDERIKEWTVDDSLLALADDVRNTGVVRFGPFIVWTSDD